MSCHLKTTGRIQGVSELRTFFFPHLNKEEEEKEEDADDGWGDSDWGWEATENKVSIRGLHWPESVIRNLGWFGIEDYHSKGRI